MRFWLTLLIFFLIFHIITFKLLYWYVCLILALINSNNIESVERLAKKDKMWKDVLSLLKT